MKKNEMVSQGIVYPLALFCLCKADDEDGYKLTLEYLKTLNPESKEKRDIARYNVFRNVFYPYNPRLKKLEDFKKDFETKLAKLEKAQQQKSAKKTK